MEVKNVVQFYEVINDIINDGKNIIIVCDSPKVVALIIERINQVTENLVWNKKFTADEIISFAMKGDNNGSTMVVITGKNTNMGISTPKGFSKIYVENYAITTSDVIDFVINFFEDKK
uniref:Uncharacterized protein n=1 Tax=Pectobacterium phage Amona TaxID=3158137 RepID=A0AB39ABG6_9CAUD